MVHEVDELWPELAWIENAELKEKVRKTWVLALERSPLTAQDLHEIPFTLLVPDCPVTFMEHKRCVVDVSRRAAESIREFMGDALPIDMDVLIAGAILIDVGKLLEYEKVDGKARQSQYGRYVRHPFSGVGLAMECGIPDKICHIIAAHSGEGDHVRRSIEATLVHHADFMTFLPFKTLAAERS